jgi:hypothetical protein
VSTSDAMKPLAAFPTPDGSGFSVKGENPILSPLAQLRSFPICIDRPDGYEIVRTDRVLHPGNRASVEVTCPAGKVLIGGGFNAEAGVHTAMSAPKLDGSAWVGLFRSDAVVGDRKTETYAVCAAASAIPDRQITESGRSQVPGGVVKSLELRCGSGKKALAIGYSVDATTTTLGGLYWLSPETAADPRNHTTRPVETWNGAIKNTSAEIENVIMDIRLVAICATASF